ncbi:unnamed protein product, partial [Rotaria magnacalcarata]
MQEERTPKRKLKQYGLIVTEEVGRYGVVGTLKSVPPGHRRDSLQTIVSRNISPNNATVISVGAIQGGSFNSVNVMPSEIRIGCITRSFTKLVRHIIERRIKELAHGLAQILGCTVQIEYNRLGTTLVNHDEETTRAVKAAESLVDKEHVNANATPFTSGEDFAYFLKKKPGDCMYMGNGIDAGALHSSIYIFNDESMPFGVGYWISLVQQELKPSVL